MGCLIISLTICLVPLAVDFSHFLGLFVILGAGEAVIWPSLGALATEEGRVHGHGTVMGVFNLSMSTGIFLGSIGAGWVMDRFGLPWSFTSAGVAVLFLSLAGVALMRGEPVPEAGSPML